MQHKWGLSSLLVPIVFLACLITIDMVRPIAELMEVLGRLQN